MSTAIRPTVRLASEIADQFRHKPVEQAAEAVAGHIRMFWDPRMRDALSTAHDSGEIEDPIVRRALAFLEA